MTPAEKRLDRDTGLELPDRRTRPTDQVQQPLTDGVRTVIEDDSGCRHKNDTFPLRTIFALKKTRAT